MKISTDINKTVEILLDGGVILYPSDTIWGIGCDATNENAVRRIYNLKKRIDNKSMIILLADVGDIEKYAEPDSAVTEFLASATKPTTAIYNKAKGIATNLVSDDGTIGIRITSDDFCKNIIRLTGKPLVSTSANISGKPFPHGFAEITEEIKSGVDYIVQHRRKDITPYTPSQIIKTKDGKIFFIRS